MKPLRNSPYSLHFNHLVYLGAWLIDSENEYIVYLYSLYKVIIVGLETYGGFGLLKDFYHWLGDLKKMSWNLCVTTMLITMLLKNHHLLNRNEVLNRLRMRLHRDAELRNAKKDFLFNNIALQELKIMRKTFYVCGIFFIPFWLTTRYFVHRELPLPYQVPDHVDLRNDSEFTVVFIGVALAGVFGIYLSMETELAMFGLLIQISREYKVLIREVSNLNEFYEFDFPEDAPKKKDSKDRGMEVNPWLKTARTKMLVKKLSHRLQELIQYTEAFEYCYNTTLFEQFFGLCAVTLALSFQSLKEDLDIRGNLIYQLGYLSIVIIDMFAICLYATRIHSQCIQVGAAAYSTFWYRMRPDIRRDLSFIILRTQNPPKITTGKLMKLNLNFFLMRMGNMYSWLAMLRQVDFKIKGNV